MDKPSLRILAAGIGSRYGGCKQIDPVGPNGEIIIDYSIYDALRAGFGKIVMVTRPELEDPIREHLLQTLGTNLDLAFAFQNLDDLPEGFTVPAGRTKPWGTGHAIWAARHEIETSFAVINADDFYGAGSYRLLHDFLVAGKAGEFCMAGFDLTKTLSAHGSVSRGICQIDFRGYLVDVVEHSRIQPIGSCGAQSLHRNGTWRPLPSCATASMNFWGFDPSIMRHLEWQFREFLASANGDLKSEFFIPTVVDTAIKQGQIRCKVLHTLEQWFGMTYKQDRKRAALIIQNLIASEAYPRSLRDSGGEVLA